MTSLIIWANTQLTIDQFLIAMIYYDGKKTISFLRLTKMPELQFQIIDLKIMKADFTLIEERKIRR